MISKDAAEAKIRELGPWFHQIEILPDVKTRSIYPSEGPQPLEHPFKRWEVFKDHIPADLAGMRVLDIGCADGFFTIEMARRGADVVAHDAAGKMIRRLEWAADALGLGNKVTTRIGFVDDLPTDERYDFVLFLGLLYHLKHPFLDLERISKVSDLMYLETAIDLGEMPYLYMKPPEAGVHSVPKWFPTTSCVEKMLEFLGFSTVERLVDNTPRRASFMARR